MASVRTTQAADYMALLSCPPAVASSTNLEAAL
jgi:hypothetical protein